MNTPNITSRGIMFLLVMMATVGLMMNCLFTPAMASISHVLPISDSTVQMTMMLYMLTFAFAQLIYGPVSDRYGRRCVVWFGMVLSLLATALCYYSSSAWMLLLGRALQGVGMAAGIIMYRAIMRDVFLDSVSYSRNASAIMVTISVVIIASFAVGGLMVQYGTWRSSFLFMFVYIVLYSVIILACLNETHLSSRTTTLHWRHIFSSYRLILQQPVFLCASIFAGLSFGAFTLYFIASSFYLQHIVGLSPETYGYTASVVAFFVAMGGITNSLVMPKWKPRKTLLVASIITVLGGIAMLLLVVKGVDGVWAVVGMACVFMYGIGMGFENATALAMAPFADKAGMAGAVYGFVQLIGATLASLLVALFLHDRVFVMAVILALMSLLMLKLALRLRGYDAA